MTFAFKSRNKAKAIDRAAYLALNFEPNSNYELDIMVRRDRSDRSVWAVSTRLIFPHMHYKRKIVQVSLVKGLENRVLPARRARRPAAGHMIRRYLCLVDGSQSTLSRWVPT